MSYYTKLIRFDESYLRYTSTCGCIFILRPLNVAENFPSGTGNDVAGEVVDVGACVKNFKAGDKVVAMLNPLVSFSYRLICFLVTFYCKM